MHIELLLDQAQARQWHVYLAEQLAALPGATLSVAHRHAPARLPITADSLFKLESLVYGIASGYALELADGAAILHRRVETRPPDLIVDVTGATDDAGEVAVLRLTCNGATADLGAVDAVLTRSTPLVAVELLTDQTRRTVLRWAAGVEDHQVLTRAVGNVLGRAVQAALHVVEAVRETGGVAVAGIPELSPVPAPVSTRPALVPFVVGGLKDKIRARIGRLAGQAPTWHTGCRQVDPTGDALPELGGQAYRRLVDDGKRFYADPFVWSSAGREFLFVEEFPFATARGIISVVELEDGRALGTPHPVLELDCHLSYPFLLEHQGTTYLIPETSGRSTVELWRSVSFPDVWELDRVLIEGEVLADSTLVQQEGLWYLLAAESQRWTSTWDALNVWHAPSLFGPWTPHAENPVVMDVVTARPAGGMFHADGHLVRPAQNCAESYGSGLVFAGVDELSPTRYEQHVLGRVEPARPLTGMHTYNRSARSEVVDVYGTIDGPTFSL